MSIAPARLYLGAPGTASTTIYTVAAAPDYAIVKEVVITNTTATAATVEITINGVDWLNTSVPPLGTGSNNVLVIALSTVLNGGDVLAALQGTASACNVEVSGVTGP